jgi:DNA polymerase-3 subunit delta
LNLGKSKNITEDEIEKYVGVSKEFNVFELQNSIATKNLYKAIRIIQYFEANPKAAPLQLVLPSIYNFFSKVQMIHSLNIRDEKTIAATIGINQYFIRDYLQAAQLYNAQGAEKILLLLHHYNLRSIGINDAGTTDAMLLKEMVVKMVND